MTCWIVDCLFSKSLYIYQQCSMTILQLFSTVLIITCILHVKHTYYIDIFVTSSLTDFCYVWFSIQTENQVWIEIGHVIIKMTKYIIKTTYIQKCTQKHSADHYHKIVTFDHLSENQRWGANICIAKIL